MLLEPCQTFVNRSPEPDKVMIRKPEIAPPQAPRKPVYSTIHGYTREDPYAWLRAANWQEVMRDPARLAPDIRAHLEAENAYSRAVMAETTVLQEELFAEMKGRIKEEDSSVPAPDGPYAYLTKYVAGGQQPVLARTPRDGGEETILIDGNAEARERPFFRFGGAHHSPDHRYLAWSFDERGSELYTVRIRDLKTGLDLDDRIEGTSGRIVWAGDSRRLFYVQLNENHRPSKLYRHRLGTPSADDQLVYEEADPGFFLGVGLTQSRRFILIDSHDHETSEVRVIPADAPELRPRLVARREAGVEYAIEEARGAFYILTNDDGAEDFKIVTAAVHSASGRAAWRDLVPYQRDRLILAMTVFASHLVRLERLNGLPRIVVRRLADGAEHAIAVEEEAYSLGLIDGYEFATATLRFSYSSPTTPSEVFDYDMESRERVLRKVQEVPSGHDPAAYVARRILAPAPDGETVPVSLVHRRDTPLDGRSPLWLYGYGSYGVTIPAAFNTNILSLIDRGFIYAIAHVRGGKDKGYRWYREGKRRQKMHSFTDFIAVARHLVAEGITAPGNIVAQGGSAGGMLMGVAANLAPECFRAILAEVPFVDVLNTMLDDTLPLTPPEWPEWGNPIASKADYETIAAYSPYDNVRAQDYPHILAVAGLTDARVTYWEPAKWVARLREMKTDGSLLLLDTKMEAGHAGSPGRFDRLKEVAFVYAFGLKVAARDPR
jgi:oligopeptidase B